MGRPDVDGSLLKWTSNGRPYKYWILLAQTGKWRALTNTDMERDYHK